MAMAYSFNRPKCSHGFRPLPQRAKISGSDDNVESQCPILITSKNMPILDALVRDRTTMNIVYFTKLPISPIWHQTKPRFLLGLNAGAA